MPKLIKLTDTQYQTCPLNPQNLFGIIGFFLGNIRFVSFRFVSFTCISLPLRFSGNFYYLSTDKTVLSLSSFSIVSETNSCRQ